MSASRRKRTVTAAAMILGSVGSYSADAQLRTESPAVSSAAIVADTAAITAVMSAYEAALNGGKTDTVLPLYTGDGIFMPPYSQSAIGKDAIRSAYDAVFKELKFHVKFNIAEVVVMAPDWAYARTNSAGTTDHHSTGKTTAEANQELFIFKQGDDGKWRIARYSFSPTNPPATKSN